MDQNISRRLVAALQQLYPGSNHVAFLGMDRSSDVNIWKYAGSEGFAIVSRDADFRDLALRHGAPPQVIHLDVCNSTTDEILHLLVEAHDEVVAFGSGSDHLLVITHRR